MKNCRLLVAAIAVASLSTVAQGGTNVWFSGTATGPGAGVVNLDGGSLGSILSLTSNPSQGASSWNIVAHITTDEGLSVYDLAVRSFDAGLSGTGAAVIPNDFGSVADPAPTNGDSPGIIARIGQNDASSATPNNNGDFAVYSFNLALTGDSAGETRTLDAGTTPDSFGWGAQDFSFGSILYGADVIPVEGFDAFGGTVISITTVPEPATLSLLGLGVVALIRRRR